MPSKPPTRKTKRVVNEQRGRRAETVAALLLRLKGYRILERRYRSSAGEIDIIAARGRVFTFVAVKARRDHDAASLSVTEHQMRRIIAAAKLWLAQQNFSLDTPCRFDMITVSHYLMPRHHLNVFEDAH